MGCMRLISQFRKLESVTLLANSFGSLNIIGDESGIYHFQTLDDSFARFDSLKAWLKAEKNVASAVRRLKKQYLRFKLKLGANRNLPIDTVCV